MSTLKEKAEAILSEKENKILSENIRKDITIFDVNGSLEDINLGDYFKEGTYNIDNTYIFQRPWSLIKNFPDDLHIKIITSNCENMFSMMYALQKLPDCTFLYKPRIARCMYFNCGSLKSVYELDYTTITDAFRMYNKCGSLLEVSGTGICTPTVRDGACYMFSECYNLKEIDVEFDLSQCSTLDGMFSDCRSLLYAPKINFGNNITSYYYVFSNCLNLRTLDLSTLTNYASLDSFTGVLDGVPDDCEITVLDTDMRDWLLNIYPNLTNIIIGEEVSV